MAPNHFSRRDFLQQAMLATGGSLLLASCTGGGAKPSAAGDSSGGAALPPIEGGVVVTDPAKIPTKFAEAPQFAELAAAGKLPPVAERIGQDPLVIQPLHEVGKYGGEIRRGYIGIGDFQNANRFCAGPDNLLYWDYKQETVVPNVARGYELSNDSKVLTLHLRRGMKWSDGHPFTADDIVFWREDVNLNPDLSPGSAALRILGRPVKVVKVDDYTVQYVSPLPHPLLPRFMASWSDIGGQTQWGTFGGGGFAPKHYLSKFHPKYTSKAEIDRLAAAAGLEDWSAYFLQQNDWSLNKDLPLLTPWIVTRPINDSPWTFQANPYSIWVDVQGNQLPYIPKIIMRQVQDPEVITLRAVAGEYDVQDRSLQMQSLPVLLKNQQRSKYTIHRTPGTWIDFALRLNLAYTKDKVLGDLIRTVEFRRALSLAIDRELFNETYFLGTAQPTATMVPDDNKYFPGPEWRRKWATLDVAQANSLLDQIGLTKRDGNGFRLRPDGRGPIRLEYSCEKGFADYPVMGEMLKKQWKAIGIDTTIAKLSGNLGVELLKANGIMIHGFSTGSIDPFLSPQTIIPTDNNQGAIGIPYAKWFESGGKKGVEPPESMKLLKEAYGLYQRGFTASDKERIELGKQIFMLHADQVWSIGIVGYSMTIYGLLYAKNNIGNVPGRVFSADLVKSPANALPMTFYYK